MSRKPRRGRPSRQYSIRVRTVRRDTIDYEALARAALEQAAMDLAEMKESHDVDVSSAGTEERGDITDHLDAVATAKEPHRDRLA
ncbi:MAG: hypothetical protein QM589_17385 [Thermomicrobiales bacterium]